MEKKLTTVVTYIANDRPHDWWEYELDGLDEVERTNFILKLPELRYVKKIVERIAKLHGGEIVVTTDFFGNVGGGESNREVQIIYKFENGPAEFLQALRKNKRMVEYFLDNYVHFEGQRDLEEEMGGFDDDEDDEA